MCTGSLKFHNVSDVGLPALCPKYTGVFKSRGENLEKLKVSLWKIESKTDKRRELKEILGKRKNNITCTQETKRNENKTKKKKFG